MDPSKKEQRLVHKAFLKAVKAAKEWHNSDSVAELIYDLPGWLKEHPTADLVETLHYLTVEINCADMPDEES